MYIIQSNFGNGWETIEEGIETMKDLNHLLREYSQVYQSPIRYRRQRSTNSSTTQEYDPSKYELRPIHENVKSYYKKAYVHEYPTYRELYSYNTHVMTVKFKNLSDTENMFNRYDVKVLDTYSLTTTRHIREYLQQLGFQWYSKADIEKHFMN